VASCTEVLAFRLYQHEWWYQYRLQTADALGNEHLPVSIHEHSVYYLTRETVCPMIATYSVFILPDTRSFLCCKQTFIVSSPNGVSFHYVLLSFNFLIPNFILSLLTRSRVFSFLICEIGDTVLLGERRLYRFHCPSHARFFWLIRRTGGIIFTLKNQSCFVCFWRKSPQWARASSFTRFLDHT
jgi:hypothetical protein